MSQTDAELKLKVWKDLAISKQTLMGYVTKTLGLSDDCSTDELRAALDKTLIDIKEADSKVSGMREQTDKALADMRAEVARSEKARSEAQAQIDGAVKAQEKAERQLAIGKEENTKAIKEAKAEVAAKQRELKAISIALADSPENVVKKLKLLKKQKVEEAKARSELGAQLRSSEKDKIKFEQEAESLKTQLEALAPVATTVRELHGLCKEANKKIEKLSDDKADLIDIPELDESLLEGLEALKEDDTDSKDKKKDKAKK